MTTPTEPGRRRLEVNDPAKLLLLAVCLVGGFASLIFAQVQGDGAQTTGVGIIMAVLGYLTGNGRLARSGKAPQPTLTSPAQELPDDEADG